MSSQTTITQYTVKRDFRSPKDTTSKAQADQWMAEEAGVMSSEEVGYASMIGWTDVHPFEIVRVISESTIEVRAMDAVLDPNWKPEFVVGGFAGHCTNQHSQKWVYSSNQDAEVVRIRRSKKKGWADKYGQRYMLLAAPRKFHDYNF